MRLIYCEQCGSNDLRKLGENILVCHACGSRYLLDETEKPITQSQQDRSVQAAKLMEQAQVCYNSDQYSKSAELLSQAAELDPRNADIWIRLGRSYRILGFHEKALQCYEQAKKINPNDTTLYSNIAILHMVNGDDKTASEYFSRAIDMIEHGAIITPGDKATAYGNYAIAAARLGDKKKAEKLMRQAERLGYANAARAREIAGLKKRWF